MAIMAILKKLLPIKEVINHPSFDPFTYDNDIAAIKVSNTRRLKCKQNIVWPACLPTRGE